MRAKVYLETTIPSYLVARLSRDPLVAVHQRLTQDWWQLRRFAFDLYFSGRALEDGDASMGAQRLAALANIPVLLLTSGIMDIAESLLRHGPIPCKATVDAIHIAIATVYGCEFLLTWNCRHIANAEIRRGVAQVVRKQGFELPVICTPEELMGEGE